MDSLSQAMKAALREAFEASGMSKAELARRLGCHEGEARRILNPSHPTKVKTMSRAALALGKRFAIRIDDIDTP